MSFQEDDDESIPTIGIVFMSGLLTGIPSSIVAVNNYLIYVIDPCRSHKNSPPITKRKWLNK